MLVGRCLNIEHTNTSNRFVLIWPPDFAASLEDEVITISDKTSGQTMHVGDHVIIEGKKIPVDWQSELYRKLRNELPGDCNGPYLLITEIDSHI